MFIFLCLALIANVCCALDDWTAKDVGHPSTEFETSKGQNNYYTLGLTTVALDKSNGNGDEKVASAMQLNFLPALPTERIDANQTNAGISNVEPAERHESETPADIKGNYSGTVITRVNTSVGQSYSLLDVTTRVNNATVESSRNALDVTLSVNRSNGESSSQFPDLSARPNRVTGNAPPVAEAFGHGASRRVNVPERFVDTVTRHQIEEPTSVTLNTSDVEDKASREGPNNPFSGFMSDESLGSNNVENEIPSDSEELGVPFSVSKVSESTPAYLVTTTTTTSSPENGIGHIPAPTAKRTTVPVTNNSLISNPNETKETTKTVSGPNDDTEGTNSTVFTTDTPLSDVTTREVEPPSLKPFLVLWNIPSKKCGTRYGILPKLSKYGIIHNTHQHFYGEEIVIFYANHLGFYPRMLADGEVVNGGIPQVRTPP